MNACMDTFTYILKAWCLIKHVDNFTVACLFTTEKYLTRKRIQVHGDPIVNRSYNVINWFYIGGSGVQPMKNAHSKRDKVEIISVFRTWKFIDVLIFIHYLLMFYRLQGFI
jgi:hypothetical protein